MADASSQAELIARAIAGERAALEELLLDNYDRLANRISKKISAGMQAAVSSEDVLQETFLEAANRIQSFEPRGADAFYRWLATIAEHRVVDLARAQQAAKRGGEFRRADADWTGSMVDLLSVLAVNERTPSRSVAGREAAAAIGAALEQINADYREALRLRYIEGLSVAATAERMGRSERAVHMLCHRGLAQLRDVLGPDSKYLSRKA